MKIALPHTPKAKLAEIIRRRGQTLASFLEELHLGTFDRMVAYCAKQHIVPVSREDYDAAQAMNEMSLAETDRVKRSTEELKEDSDTWIEPMGIDRDGEVYLPVEEINPPLPAAKKKKPRNALVKASEKPETE